MESNSQTSSRPKRREAALAEARIREEQARKASQGHMNDDDEDDSNFSLADLAKPGAAMNESKQTDASTDQQEIADVENLNEGPVDDKDLSEEDLSEEDLSDEDLSEVEDSEEEEEGEEEGSDDAGDADGVDVEKESESDSHRSSKKSSSKTQLNINDGDRAIKRPRNIFIEEEAEVDEEDEGDEIDEGEDDDNTRDAFAAERDEVPEVDYTTHRRMESALRLENEDEADVASYFRQKYGKSYSRPSTNEYVGSDSSTIPQQSLLPTVTDPKLWTVKCRVGREREILRMLMKHMDDLQIIAALAPEHIPGYIYLEATKLAHVQHALTKVRYIFASKMSLVPLSEMVDVVASRQQQKQQVSLKTGDWVRIKRGKYAADLGQLIELDEERQIVLIKLIPRLEDPTKKEVATRRLHSSKRPPQRKFQPDHLAQLGAQIQKSRGFFIYNGERFRDGFLFKEMSLTSIDLKNGSQIIPSIDELSSFNTDQSVGAKESDMNEDDEIDSTNPKEDNNTNTMMASLKEAERRMKQVSLDVYQPGDFIQVTEGDLKHLMGTVLSVDNETNMITMMPKHEELEGTPLTFPGAQLKRYFTVGEHVKVNRGKYEGETGMIVRIDEEIIHLFSDVTRIEIQVLSRDIRICSQIATGVATSIGMYDLHDLVQLDASTVGVLVQLDKDTMRILDQNEQLKAKKPSDILYKKASINKSPGMALDSQNRPIKAGDDVENTNGVIGTVLHIYRSIAFIYAKTLLENHGVFVARTRYLKSLRATSNTLITTPTGVVDKSIAQSNDLSQPRRRDYHLLNKSVRIAGGPWKGYVGMIIDTTEDTARVELHTKNKTITIDKTKLILEGTGSGLLPIASSVGGQTPAYDYVGGRTPMHYTMNPQGRTPMGNSQGGWTPNALLGAAGGRTPAWMDGGRTPAWTGDIAGRTPNYTAEGFSSMTPMNVPATPGGNQLSFNTPTPGGPMTVSYSTPGINYDQLYTPASGPVGLPVTNKSNAPVMDGGWVKGVLVQLKTNNKLLVVDSVIGNTCHVKELDKSSMMTCYPMESLIPVIPVKKDCVCIIGGTMEDGHGLTGTLIGIDGTDGIVKLDETQDFKILSMLHLAKYHPDNE